MDRTKTTDEHSKALRRIVAVLLALADLAERASGRWPAVRVLVLWLLRSGEAMARDYLAGLTPRSPRQNEPTAVPLTDASPTEAVRLAASFRQMAAALAALAHWSAGASPRGDAARRDTLRLYAPAAIGSFAESHCPTPAFDSS